MSIDEPETNRRPAEYTREIGSSICDRLFDETLREICADPAMPDKATVLRWLAQHGEFRENYESVRAGQYEDLVFETLPIVDDTTGYRVEKVRRRDGKVVTVWDRNNLVRTRLRCDIRHWVADRLRPKKATDQPVKQRKGVK